MISDDCARPLPDIEVVSPLDWLLKTIIYLGERFEMMTEFFDAIFDEFIKYYQATCPGYLVILNKSENTSI